MASGHTLAALPAQAGIGTSSTPPQFDTRGGVVAAWNFDGAATEKLYFTVIIPRSYAGGGVTVDIFWMALTATSNNAVFDVSFVRLNTNNQDLDAVTFAAAQQCAAVAANAASGKLSKSTVNIADGAAMDSAAAGDFVVVRIQRLPADAGDTITTDVQLVAVEIREQ